ncbi:MAG: XRE family transcriptional regulator [Actinobacteria bacterium]|nr:XRE family transcriptional regulator [Actinomycetota bacterium]
MKKENLSITVGENIKRALKESRISQEQASGKLNISRQTLINYINGSTLIDFEKLLNIASLTDRGVDFFYKTNQVFGNYKFRSDIPISTDLKIKFEERIRKYDELEKINKISPFQLKIGLYLDKLDKGRIENMAEKTRCLLDIGLENSISNPIYELEKNGIKIIQFPAENQDISGFSANNEKLGDCIFLNSKCTIERRFFTAIHELGHLIFHKDDYRGDLKVENERIKEDIANEFAGLLLIPSKSLNEFIASNFIEKISFNDVINLKKYFNVSAKCIIKRLFKDGIIDKKEHEQLNKKVDEEVDQYNEPDPIGEDRNIENYRFKNLVKKAFLEGEITVSRIAELLEVSTVDANKKAQEWANN